MKKEPYSMLMLTAKDILGLRLALGLTPTAFAARLGVSASTVCLWENDKRHPRYEMMLKLNELRLELRNGRPKAVAAK